MRQIFTFLALVTALMTAGEAAAQAPAPQGSTSSVFTCFYECKKGLPSLEEETWQEVTTLMLANQNYLADRAVEGLAPVVIPPGPTSNDPLAQVNETLVNLRAQMFFIDGNRNVIATAGTILEPFDLDEVNICRTLRAGGIEAPSAGLVQVLVFDVQELDVALEGNTILDEDIPLDGFGAYGWVKNVVGKFFRSVDEPFDGRVNGVGKTVCREGPPEVTVRVALNQIIALLGGPDPVMPPEIDPILIEDTGEPDPAPRILLQLLP